MQSQDDFMILFEKQTRIAEEEGRTDGRTDADGPQRMKRARRNADWYSAYLSRVL